MLKENKKIKTVKRQSANSDLKLKLLDIGSRHAICVLYIYNWLVGLFPINVETTEPELVVTHQTKRLRLKITKKNLKIRRKKT